MIQFLLCLIPVCLGIWGVHILFQEDHLLEKVGDFLDEYMPKYFNKPTWACPICMSSLWGLLGFFTMESFFGVSLPIQQLIPFIFCLCGLNTIILNLTSKKRIIQEFDSEAFRQLFDMLYTRNPPKK